MKRWLLPFLGLGLLISPLDSGCKEVLAQEGCIRFPYRNVSRNPGYFLLDIETVGKPDYESRRIPATDSRELEICDLKPRDIYKIRVSECTSLDGMEDCTLSDSVFVGFAKKK